MTSLLSSLFLFVFPILTSCPLCLFFFFNDTATTEIYTLSLHDALPISSRRARFGGGTRRRWNHSRRLGDRKSTRLNSSHVSISYAVFCLKKKKDRGARCLLYIIADIHVSRRIYPRF